MQTKDGFTAFTIAEFEAWIASISVARTITTIQLHHTWRPSYAEFSGSNHFALQKNMKHYHVVEKGWSDIGQNLTIFPDGTVMTGRPLNATPACIYANNAGAVCIENLGDFDSGRDQMTAAHREAIIRATRALLARFSAVPKNDQGVVYHHWFDLNTGQRTNGSGSTKSCPGTAFFGGNTVAAFNANLLPLLTGAVAGAGTGTTTPPPQPLRLVAVTADALNIRTGPGTGYSKTADLGPAQLGSILRVWAEQDGWLKISNSKAHWVFGKYTEAVRAGTVNTADTNVRAGPGTGFEVMTVYQPGHAVYAREDKDGWSRVGAGLWIRSSLITLA